MKTWFNSALIVSVSLFTLPSLLPAQTQMNLHHVFSSGAVPPANSTTPWLIATFIPQSANSVLFTLTGTTNMTNPEKITEFYFNFDDTLTVNDLSFTLPTTSGAFTLPTISKGMNALKADGDGFYDLNLSFTSGGGLAEQFTRGDSLSYLLTYSSGNINAASFSFQSEPGGGEGTYYSAAHIQSTPDGGSAWLGSTTVIPVPEPTTLSLLLLGAPLALRLLHRNND